MSVSIWKSRLDRALEVLRSTGAEVGAGASSVSLPPVALVDAERELGRPIPLSIRSLLTASILQGYWRLSDVIEERMPAESCGVLWGGVDLTVQEVLAAETSRRSWLTECFPNPSDPYDSVWHGKFAFHTVGNGDCLAIADSDERGPVYYLSHDDGEGHGLQLLARLLWTPKPTHEVLDLPKPISVRVLAELDALQDDRNDGIADQIHLDAQEVFSEALRGRGVPDDTYQLLIGSGLEQHRVRRPLDGCSWSLLEFDDFIDLGLNPRGGQPATLPPTRSQHGDDDRRFCGKFDPGRAR